MTELFCGFNTSKSISLLERLGASIMFINGGLFAGIYDTLYRHFEDGGISYNLEVDVVTQADYTGTRCLC
jgi:hypothetical protein